MAWHRWWKSQLMQCIRMVSILYVYSLSFMLVLLYINNLQQLLWSSTGLHYFYFIVSISVPVTYFKLKNSKRAIWPKSMNPGKSARKEKEVPVACFYPTRQQWNVLYIHYRAARAEPAHSIIPWIQSLTVHNSNTITTLL